MKFKNKLDHFENPFLKEKNRIPNLRRLALAVFGAFATMALLFLGAGYAYHSFYGSTERVLAKIEKNLGSKVKIGEREIGFDYISFRNIELVDLDHAIIDEIKVQLGFGEKGGLPKISKVDVRIKAAKIKVSTVRDWANDFRERLQEQSTNQTVTNANAWRSLLQAPEAVHFQIGLLSLTDDEGQNYLATKNTKGRFDHPSQLLDLVTDAIVYEGQELPQIKLNAFYKEDLKQLSIRATQTGESAAPSVSLSSTYDIERAQANLRMRAQGAVIAKLPGFSRVIAPNEASAIQIHILLKHAAKFASLTATMTANAQNVYINDTRVAKHQVGPVDTELKAMGTYVKSTGVATLKQFDLLTSSRDISVNPLKASLTGTAKVDNQYQLSSVTAKVDIPETSCKSLQNLDKKNLTPQLNAFQASGVMKGQLAVNWKRGSGQSTVDIADLDLGCLLTALDEGVSPTKLAEPAPYISAFQQQSKFKPIYPLNSFYSFKNIPQRIVRIFLASEDIAFYQHEGIDASSLISAAERNLNTDKNLVGGSTISMQVAKNLFLSGERTFARKLQEVFLTRYLEKNLSKNRILELYFNIAEFGPGVYGINNASQHFFGKSPADLSTLEITYLASLLPAPVKRYQYFCSGYVTPNMEQLVDQKLDSLRKLGRINESEYSESINGTISFNAGTRKSSPHCRMPQQHASLPLEADET